MTLRTHWLFRPYRVRLTRHIQRTHFVETSYMLEPLSEMPDIKIREVKNVTKEQNKPIHFKRTLQDSHETTTNDTDM